jgi:dTDP-4-dehydrorhamnose reductase
MEQAQVSMKILITGSQGMLASDVIRELDCCFDIHKRDRAHLDICDKENVFKDIRDLKPDYVINCAAFTNVDACEKEKDKAFSVNAEGTKNLALACRETGSVLCHISTDFVFDGNKKEPYVENDRVSPLSVYAKSKLEGERNIQAILSRYIIVRSSWLFGKNGKNFVTTIIKLSKENDVIKIVNDQIGSPTYTVDLAKAIKALLDINAQGIYHFCNDGVCTWYEFAKKIIDLTGLKTGIVPITSQQLARPAVRPPYSAMNCGKFINDTGIQPRPWVDALGEYLNGLEGNLNK